MEMKSIKLTPHPNLQINRARKKKRRKRIRRRRTRALQLSWKMNLRLRPTKRNPKLLAIKSKMKRPRLMKKRRQRWN